MRIRIRFANEKLNLPIGYNGTLQGLIYNLLPPLKASLLHSKGVQYNGRSFKLFTFSKLWGKYEIKEKRITFFKPSFYLGFVDEKLGKGLIERLIELEEILLDKKPIELEEVKILKRPQLTQETFLIKTLSPICVYTTPAKKKLYLTPNDKEFQRILKENIRKKFIAITKKEPKEFEFKIEPNKKFNVTAVRYKGGVIKGVEGEFKVTTNPQLFLRVYDAGIGANSSLGFGMVEVVDQN